MSSDQFGRLLEFLNRLKEAKISFTLAFQRHDAVMIEIAVPGQRWEVEFLADGSVEVEVFMGAGDIRGEDAIEDLFSKFSD